MVSERDANDFIGLLDSERSDEAVRRLISSQVNAPTFAYSSLEQARVWLESTLTRHPDGDGREPQTFRRTRALCSILVLLGHRDDAFTRAHELLTLAQKIDDPLLIWDAHFTLSLFHQQAGELASAAKHGQEALSDGRTTRQEERNLALFLTYALNDVHWQSSLSVIDAIIAEEAGFADREPWAWRRQFAAGDLAQTCIALGMLATGARIFRANIVAAQANDLPALMIAGLTGVASLALALDRPEQALFHLSTANAMTKRPRSDQRIDSDFGGRIMQSSVSELSDASRRTIWTLGQSTPPHEAIAEAFLVVERAIAISRSHQGLPQSPGDVLTRHERQLLSLQAAGFEREAIAERLSIRRETLARREKRLAKKLLPGALNPQSRPEPIFPS